MKNTIVIYSGSISNGLKELFKFQRFKFQFLVIQACTPTLILDINMDDSSRTKHKFWICNCIQCAGTTSQPDERPNQPICDRRCQSVQRKHTPSCSQNSCCKTSRKPLILSIWFNASLLQIFLYSSFLMLHASDPSLS